MVRCVSTDGTLGSNFAYDGNVGVRPLCILKSEIFVSVEPEEGEERAAELDKMAEEAVQKIGAILNGLPTEAREAAAKGALNAFAKVAMDMAFFKMTGIDPAKMRERAGDGQKKEE